MSTQWHFRFNSLALTHLPPSAAYIHQWTGSSLVRVMACRLFGAKPLPEPMLVYCQLDSWEQVTVNVESEFYNFHSTKCIWKCRLPKWRPFCPRGDELSNIPTWTDCREEVSIFTGGQFWPSGIVIACVFVSMCVSVHVCVNHEIFRALTHYKLKLWLAKFGPEVQNTLIKIHIVLWCDWHRSSRSNSIRKSNSK